MWLGRPAPLNRRAPPAHHPPLPHRPPHPPPPLQVLLLFLQLAQLELGGALGGRHIQHLQLGNVLKPHRPKFSLVSSAARLIGRYF